jgi:transposase-like protein
MAHNEETKAAAMAALLAGQSVGEVAREYTLPPSTVSRWRKEARAEAGLSDDIGALLLDYLAANLETLQTQAVVFGDTEWLQKQGASELAILHGVMTDKAVRLLEALSGGPMTEKRNG